MTLLSLTCVTGHMREGRLGGGSSWTLSDSDLLHLRGTPGQGETVAMAASTLAHTAMVFMNTGHYISLRSFPSLLYPVCLRTTASTGSHVLSGHLREGTATPDYEVN